MRRAVCFLGLLAVLGALAGGLAAEEKKALPDAARLERFLRRYYGWPDPVKVTVGELKPSAVAGLLETTVKLSHDGQQQETTFLVSADGQHLLTGPPITLNADPFAATRAKIDLKDAPSLGAPLAQVTIVEYSDFQCSFCRAFAAVLRGDIVKAFSTDVRLVYKDFPLSQIHPWANQAAALGRCITKRYGDAFWSYHDWVFATQQQLAAETFKQKALAFAKEKGMDPAQLGTCMEQREVRAEVNRSLEEGESLGVSGTPTIFINGRKLVGNQTFEQVSQMVKMELDYVRGK